MEFKPLDLADLVPKEATFTIGTGAEAKALTLCRFSLRVRAWATSKYSSGGLKMIFERQQIVEIADIAWFMLKEKEKFPKGQDEFFDAILTVQDQINLIKALMFTIGIGEPEIAQLEGAAKALEQKAAPNDPKPKAPKKKIGAKSSTP